jgi:aminoglycoside N3'-acetyltransferase
LADVKIAAGDLVMAHSSLLGLGRLADYEISSAPNMIVSYLRDYLGPHGTLVVPTFNFGFCHGEVFDRQNTPSEQMGLLSEVVRRLPNAVRSRHPMQSIAAIGPRAEEICDRDTPSAFDRRGSFEALINMNATLLMLGASLQAASILHFAEQQVGVPYRYWKDFSGPYVDNGQEEKKTYRMYVRDLDLDPQLVMTTIEDELYSLGQLQKRPLGSGQIRSCSFQDLNATAKRCLERDPNCMVSLAHSD